MGDYMKRLLVLKIILYISMSIMILRLFYIQVLQNEYYKEEKIKMTEKIIEGDTAPRGRIYDRNGVLIVDNKPNKVIYYNKEAGITKKEELEIVKHLSELIEVNYVKATNKTLKDYYLIINSDIDLITQQEKKLYSERKLTDEDIKNLKYERITDEDLKDINKEEAYIYYLMNNGYSYLDKIIKDDNVTEYEYAIIAENINSLPGVGIKLNWEREYLYDDVFRSILGKVGNVSKEKLSYYMDKGYAKNDIVGLSYLEYQYDDYLKGIKNKYKVKNKSYKLINDGKRGNDMYLTIDIVLQKQIDNIIVESLLEAKKTINTKYLDKSFVIITNPKTGEILAMSGKQVIDGNVYDYTPGIITTSYVMGSTVKGASHIVGYNNNAIKIGEIRDDSCVKVKGVNEKCSWKYLGLINDIEALKYSSNTYQFKTAIKVSKGVYSYNASIKLDDSVFKLYRDTFKEFGLGVLTGIDLPNEALGYTSNKEDIGLLLNFTIGQYDTYTPIQLAQYISTIANDGIRVEPYLVSKFVNSDNEVVYEKESVELNNVNTTRDYLTRIKEGFKQVLEPYGTGYNYINPLYNGAGKTGTSQSFIDTNLDGKIDTETISTAFVGYVPYDNPLFTITVISPDVSDLSNKVYKNPITKTITRKVTDAYFSRY